MYQIINSNVLDFKTDKKYHAIISDPPYGLAFMGKGWDKFKTPLDYQKWVTEWSSHLMQFLYPGAICMFFGGTRTYHRLATGLEDSGYEIFDSMMWCYGSGFPKATDISKLIDKQNGLEREIEYTINKTHISTENTNEGYKRPSHVGKTTMDITKPNHPLAQKWNGYKTAIKPAFEPVVICRKPLEKGGYVNSVLKYGTSGLNIDGGRIGTDEIRTMPKLKGDSFTHLGNGEGFNGTNGNIHKGRFPANFGLICDCEKEPCECDNGNLGESSRFFYTAKASSKERELGLEELPKKFLKTMNDGIGSREHNENEPTAFRHNNHPTVKPIKLIEYLAKLIIPPIDNSSILIPFSGVGSEMIGCHLAGWQNITGIEIDEHYVEIANKRLEHWTQFDNYQDALKSKVIET